MREYAQAVGRESAREMLAARAKARTIAGIVTRGLMGALVGAPRRRTSRRRRS